MSLLPASRPRSLWNGNRGSKHPPRRHRRGWAGLPPGPAAPTSPGNALGLLHLRTGFYSLAQEPVRGWERSRHRGVPPPGRPYGFPLPSSRTWGKQFYLRLPHLACGFPGLTDTSRYAVPTAPSATVPAAGHICLPAPQQGRTDAFPGGQQSPVPPAAGAPGSGVGNGKVEFWSPGEAPRSGEP